MNDYEGVTMGTLVNSINSNNNNNPNKGSYKNVSHRKPQRTPSNLGDKLKQLLGVEPENPPPRSRRGLFQSVSSTNLSSQSHQPSTSLPPQIPRSFYLGELDIPANLRGSRSMHNSPHPPCSLQQRFDSKRIDNQRNHKSLSPSDSCSTPHTDSCSDLNSSVNDYGSKPPYYVSDTFKPLDVPLTSELTDTNNSNSSRNRHESHLMECFNQSVQLRRHRSTHALDHAEYEQTRNPSNRHSVHFDSVNHAMSGLETLDFPVRKKTWPPDGARVHPREGYKEKNIHEKISRETETSKKDCCSPKSSGSCGCSLVNSSVYQKMMTIAGQHQPYYIMCCCSGPGQLRECLSQQHAHAPPRAICCSGLTDQYELDHRLGHCCSGPTQLQPRIHEGQHQRGGLEEVGGHQVIHQHQVGEHQSLSLYGGGCEKSEIQSENNSDEMVLETSHLWSGVSGVPGLGVSIPRPRSSAPGSSLEEWDRHENGCKRRQEDSERKSSVSTTSSKKDSQVGSRNAGPLSLSGVKVELPRVISPRSSSCRSSGRSTGSRGSSALSQGLSNGSSASSAKYSNRSDSVFSVHAPLPRIQSPLRGSQERGTQRTIIPHSQYDHHHHNHHHNHYGHHAQTTSHHQSKSIQNTVKSVHRSSNDRPNAKRKGNGHSNSSSESGPTSLPSNCECVCTCGDPIPPKPVRRVMFSDDTCHCDEDKMKSLPVFTDSHSSHDCCCSSPRFDPDLVEGQTNESAFCSSPVPNNHYKSPRDVDGEYSYAYSDSVSPAFLIRVGAAMEYSGSQEESEDSRDENIYEEIREKSEEHIEEKSPAKESRKSSTTSQEISSTSSETPKSKFQKAIDAVTRRSSRSLDAGSEKSFHLSISKGRKKSLIDKAKVDWDCEGTPGMISKFNKSSSDMFGEVNASHNRVMSQLKLDVEDMLMPPPSPPSDETQDDSGFHSGGMSSNNSYSPKSKRKSIIKPPKTAKRSESQPGRMNRCESIDFKEAFHDGRKTSEVFRTRSKIISDHNGTYGNAVYGPPPVYSGPPPMLVPNGNKKGTVNRSYLSKLVNFPFMGSNKNHPPIYGKNNNLPPNYEDESGRTFYL